MTGTFAGWLIKTGVTDYGGLGRLTKEWTGDKAIPYNSRRTNNYTFTQFLGERFPDQYQAYRAYIRLTDYQPYNKDT